jgi:hypothetical protein
MVLGTGRVSRVYPRDIRVPRVPTPPCTLLPFLPKSTRFCFHRYRPRTRLFSPLRCAFFCVPLPQVFCTDLPGNSDRTHRLGPLLYVVKSVAVLGAACPARCGARCSRHAVQLFVTFSKSPKNDQFYGKRVTTCAASRGGMRLQAPLPRVASTETNPPIPWLCFSPADPPKKPPERGAECFWATCKQSDENT